MSLCLKERAQAGLTQPCHDVLHEHRITSGPEDIKASGCVFKLKFGRGTKQMQRRLFRPISWLHQTKSSNSRQAPWSLLLHKVAWPARRLWAFSASKSSKCHSSVGAKQHATRQQGQQVKGPQHEIGVAARSQANAQVQHCRTTCCAAPAAHSYSNTQPSSQ